MMHKDAITTIERIPISRIIVEQVEVKDGAKVLEYAETLRANPNHDLGFFSVRPLDHGYYALEHGHHRYCACIIAGRADHPATVVDERHIYDSRVSGYIVTSYTPG